MEEAILRSGNLKKFEKFIRKRGVEAILDEETFQLILSNTIYSDFDIMGMWIQEVLKAHLWHKVTRATASSLQAAPFRMVKFERLTPKRLTKTLEAIIQNHQEKKSLAIRYWLPWIILYTEEVDPKYPDKLDDVIFCLFFYEALDFAFRAKASAQTFRHMFHTDRLKTQVRARYLRFCNYCIENHLGKCGKIQYLGENVCEIAPIILAYNLGLPRLASSIMTFMDDEYLAHIRQTFLDQAMRNPSIQTPTYFFEAHEKKEGDDRSRDVPAFTFTKEHVAKLYDQRELIVYLANTAKDLFDPIDLLDFHDVTRDVLIPSSKENEEWIRSTFCSVEEDLRTWLENHPERAIDVVVDLAEVLPPTLVSSRLLSRVFYEVPFLPKYLPFVKEPFHVHAPSLPSYLYFCLDCICRNDLQAFQTFLALTRSLPRGWRDVTSQKPKLKEIPLEGTPYDRHWARFFDRQIAKMLKENEISVEAWTLLCTHGFPSLLTPYLAHRKERTTWDEYLLGLKGLTNRVAFLNAFWCRYPLGTYPFGCRSKRSNRTSWSPLMWIISFTPSYVEDAKEVWTLAEKWCPNFLYQIGGSEGMTALHLARDKTKMDRPIRDGAQEWLKERLGFVKEQEKNGGGP